MKWADLRIQTSIAAGEWGGVTDITSPLPDDFTPGDEVIVADSEAALPGDMVTIRILYIPSGGILLKTDLATGEAPGP